MAKKYSKAELNQVAAGMAAARARSWAKAGVVASVSGGPTVPGVPASSVSCPACGCLIVTHTSAGMCKLCGAPWSIAKKAIKMKLKVKMVGNPKTGKPKKKLATAKKTVPSAPLAGDDYVDVHKIYNQEDLETQLYDEGLDHMVNDIENRMEDMDDFFAVDDRDPEQMLLRVLHYLAKDGNHDFFFLKNEDAREFYSLYEKAVEAINDARMECDRVKALRESALAKLTDEERKVLRI
jgi:hypothetical protein